MLIASGSRGPDNVIKYGVQVLQEMVGLVSRNPCGNISSRCVNLILDISLLSFPFKEKRCFVYILETEGGGRRIYEEEQFRSIMFSARDSFKSAFKFAGNPLILETIRPGCWWKFLDKVRDSPGFFEVSYRFTPSYCIIKQGIDRIRWDFFGSLKNLRRAVVRFFLGMLQDATESWMMSKFPRILKEVARCLAVLKDTYWFTSSRFQFDCGHIGFLRIPSGLQKLTHIYA